MANYLRQVGQLFRMNLRAYLREPEIIFWMLIFPAAIAGVLGVAFSEAEAPRLPVAVVASAGTTQASDSPNDAELQDAAESPEARGAPQAFRILAERTERSLQTEAHPVARIELEYMTEAEAVRALQKGRIQLYVRANEAESGLEARFDPTNPEARLTWLALDRAWKSAAVNSAEGPALQAAEENAYEPQLRAAPIRQPGARYIDFLIPGLLALGVMNSCMWGIGYGLIDLRVKKLLRRMAASPMYKSAFLLSRFLTRLFFSVLEFAILFGFAWVIFGVTVQGSWTALALLFVTGTLAWSGIAVFCSSRARSVNTANGIINAVTLPMTILSGIFFSYRNFPEWSQELIQLLPLTILADSMRAVMTEGAGLAASLPAAGVMLATGIVFFAAGLRIYRWH